MQSFARRLALGLLLSCGLSAAYANGTAQTLPFNQDWTNGGLITVNDDWSAVPGIEGFLGQDLTTTTGTDPQTLTGTSAVPADLDVIANQTAPNTLSAGGVAEFAITNPVVALQGSGTGDAPNSSSTSTPSARPASMSPTTCATSTARLTTRYSPLRCSISSATPSRSATS